MPASIGSVFNRTTDRETYTSEFEDAEEVSELEMLTVHELSLMTGSPAARSPATRHPVAGTTTTTRSRSSCPSRLARREPPSASNSTPTELPAPALEGLLPAAATELDVVGNHDQPLDATRHRREQEPEFQFGIAPPPSIHHIRHGVSPSSAGGGRGRGVPPRTTRPPMAAPTPARRETEPAITRTGTGPRVVKFRAAYYVRIVLSRLPMDPPPPPHDRNTSE